jgi:hypothetical protein
LKVTIRSLDVVIEFVVENPIVPDPDVPHDHGCDFRVDVALVLHLVEPGPDLVVVRIG